MNKELIALLKEAKKIIRAHQSARLTHKDWLQRVDNVLKKIDAQEGKS